MFCSNCGGELLPDSKFCRKCGATVEPEAPAEEVELKRPGVVTLLAVLHYIAGGLHLLFTVGLIAIGLREAVIGLPLAAGLFGLGIIELLCGYGLWTLKGYGRTIQLVFAWIGLAAFPLGTLISILILYYLYQPRARILFSGKALGELLADERKILARPEGSNVVVAILTVVVATILLVFFTGMVAAIAIPNFLNAIDRGKQKRTVADIRSVATAMESYAIDNDRYPVAESLEELRELLEPEHVPTMPTVDGWNHELVVQSDGDSYTIRSPGKDGVFDSGRSRGATILFNADIVLNNGVFVQSPEGMQD